MTTQKVAICEAISSRNESNITKAIEGSVLKSDNSQVTSVEVIQDAKWFWVLISSDQFLTGSLIQDLQDAGMTFHMVSYTPRNLVALFYKKLD